MEALRAVKGMNDVLPDEMPRWHRIETAFRELAVRYGYGEVRTPLVEPTALFVRSIGEVTDIVEKEMYSFVDKGEHSLSLRPEGTASAVRAYVEHNVHGREPVTKWFYLGPMYRRERPAKGRYRQFYQAGLEVFGDPGPYADAEMIDMVVRLMRGLGVEDVEVLVNSLGGPETRPAYREALVKYLSPHRTALCSDCQRRVDQNPLRVLDCKVPADQEIARGAPRILEHLSDSDRAHFTELERTLTALGTPFRVEPQLVRGLDYYTRTLFEIRGRGGELGAQNALCGGGRYDGLVEALGGPAVPSIGFALGIERLLLAMPPAEARSSIAAFVVAASPAEAVAATVLARDLRAAGIAAEADLRGQSMKSQLRRADKLGARFALLLGSSEIERGVVQLKDLVEKSQRDVPRGEVVSLVSSTIGAPS